MMTDASSDSLLSQLQEQSQQLKLTNLKYENCARALHNEKRRSDHFLKQLVDMQLKAQPKQEQVDACESDGVRQTVNVPLETGSEMDDVRFDCYSDLETDGAVVLIGRACNPSIATAAGPRMGRMESRLEDDDAVLVRQSGNADYSTILPTTQSSDEPLSATVVKPAVKTSQEVVKGSDAKSDRTKERNSLSGKLLDDMKDAIISAMETESPVGMLVAESVPFPDSLSSDLLKKIMRQNARLKQLLRQIVDAQGISLQEFLERSDYAKLVETLKMEVARLQATVRQQSSLLKADDSELRRTCNTLTDKVTKLEHGEAVRQALVDTYSGECDKLRHELHRLATQIQVSSQAATSDVETALPAASLQATLSKELATQFGQLRGKYGEMEKFYRGKLQVVEDQLAAKTRSETDMQSLNTKLQEDYARAKQRYDEIAEEQLQLRKLVTETASMKPFARQNTVPCAVQEQRRLRKPSHRLPTEGIVVDSETPEPMERNSPPTVQISKRNASLPLVLIGAVQVAAAELRQQQQQQQQQQTEPELSDDSARVCPRCEESYRDGEAFEKHRRKCTDD